MKKSELFFDAILVPIDFVALVMAGAAAYWLRTSELVQGWREAVFVLDLPLIEYMQLVVIVAAAVIGIFALQGLYAMQVTRRLLDELTNIFSGITLGIMGVIIYIFLSAGLFQSRFILMAAYGFAIVFVSLARYFVRRLQRWLLGQGYGIYRVALVGTGRLANKFAKQLDKWPELGYRIVGQLEEVRWDKLEKIYQEKGVDEIIKLDPTLPTEKNLLLLDFCEQYKLGYKYLPDLFETYAANIRFHNVGGVPLMELERTPLEGWGRIAKRSLDVVGGMLGLVVLAPFFILTAVLIKMDSQGPVFYKQTRVGRNMKSFEIYKFRSMFSQYCTGERYGGEKAAAYEATLREKANERSGPLFKMRNDPRITKVGRVLRRTRIDELPQLINVFLGSMSLVGPRPHLPTEIVRYRKHHRRLFTIKPGMTGMAQVNGNAGLPFEQEAKLDISYIETWSLRLDLVLLIKTFGILFTDRNAV